MPTPVVANCLQAALIHDVAGQIAENVLHFNAPGIDTPTALHDALAAIATAWEDNVLPFMATDCKFVRIDGLMLNGVGSLELPFAVPGEPIGDGGGPISSQEQSFCLTKSSGRSGRSLRGRIYIIGVPAGVIAEGVVDNTWANNLKDGLNTFASSLAEGPGWALVILSRKLNEMEPFSSFQIHDYFVDVQRRRLPGHNRHH